MLVSIHVFFNFFFAEYLTLDTLSDAMVKKKFHLLHVGRYLFSNINGNR